MTDTAYQYIWTSKRHHPERIGQRCRKAMANGSFSFQVMWEFVDGFQVVAGARCARRVYD